MINITYLRKAFRKRRILKTCVTLVIFFTLCVIIDALNHFLRQKTINHNGWAENQSSKHVIYSLRGNGIHDEQSSSSFNKRRLIVVEESSNDVNIKSSNLHENYTEHSYESSEEIKNSTVENVKVLLSKQNNNKENYKEKVYNKMQEGRRAFTILASTESSETEINAQAMEKAVLRGDIRTITYNYSTCLQKQFQKNFHQFKGYAFPEIENKIRKACFLFIFGDENGNICKFPNKEIVGPLLVDFQPIKLNELENQLHFVEDGGWWKPVKCIPRNKVAIIIPFRDRETHLYILLRQLHAILRRQNLMYRIIVIEQIDEYPFNRGKLMNVGFSEALKMFPFTCFVFHDVDLIPENDLNDYGCPSSPRHLSCAVDKFDYKLPYPGIFGGVEMFTNEHFEKVNGFPNAYWGWGAEDDDLYKRISEYGFQLTRPSMQEGRYKMVKHATSNEVPPNRMDRLNNAHEEFQTDGLSSLQYKVIDVLYERFYTKIKVDLNLEGDITY